MSVLIYAMIYAGSALMVYNIVRCHGFVKRMRMVNGLEKTQRILPVPLILLVFFLIGCGILTVLIRKFGSYPEGVTYAILIMNLCSWAIDKGFRRHQFGVSKEDIEAEKAAKKAAKEAAK